jgi:hypothetical protein
LKREFTLMRFPLNAREKAVLKRGYALIELFVVIVMNSIDGSSWAVAGTRAGGEVNAFPF